MILIINKNKIFFSYNIKYEKIKKIINKYENIKIININNNLNIEKIKKINNKYNIIMINNKRNKRININEYILISDKIFIFVKSEINNIKKIYFLLNKLEKKVNIDKDKIILIIEKSNKKNGIHFLIVKSIFRKYNNIAYDSTKMNGKIFRFFR